MVGDIDDLQQVDEVVAYPISAVPVIVEGPVQTHVVPSVSGGSRSYAVLATDQPKRVGNADLRRRSITIIADVPFYVGETANETFSKYAAFWPANNACRITHSEEVYVYTLANGTVSVMTENWAN